MKYSVIVADLEKDKQTMVSILERNRNRTDTDYSKRYDWIYLNNPFGRAKAWIIYDDKKGIPIGFTGVFPRPVFVNGKEYIAWNCGDFSIDKKYRTLGVAVQLRREAKKGVDNGEVSFLYAHPNKRMEVIHFRVGHKKMSEMRRYALPLKLGRYFYSKLGSKIISQLLALPADVFLKLKYSLKKRQNVKGIILPTIQCDWQHEQIFETMKNEFKVIGIRNCKYLKWKFAEHPNFEFQQFNYYEKNTLCGSIFFSIKDKIIHIVDVLINDYKLRTIPMIISFINVIYENNLGNSLSFILQKDNPIIPLLEIVGFRERDDATSSVIAYANEARNPELAEIIINGANWFMTVGDRDA